MQKKMLHIQIRYEHILISKIIVIWLSRNQKRAKKRRKFGISWLVCITQTPDRQYGVLTHIDDFKGFLTS